ncbi:histidine-rich glycoprotein-like [Aedes albopictus]|uniref:Uncharacterized protein n=1 Tax=Aedes albopictus TaxID=7160 RepID=A0ABM2A1A1_AEDAL|nr:histidine-rich glycoprotein-like isoform X2 [Aedes albopictus]
MVADKMKPNMLLPILVLVISIFDTALSGEAESHTTDTARHDLHVHDHLHTADLHHDHLHVAPEFHHDLHHDVHHDLHHDVHHDLHHHDVHHYDVHHAHATPVVADHLHTEVHHHDVVQGHGDHLHHSHHDVVVATPHASGFWKKSFIWKPRWVKSWHEKKIYVPVWKHVWGPVQMSEWVPIPRPPPNWQKH